MSKTPKSTFSLQNFNFRFNFFFDQNLDFVLGTHQTTSRHGKTNTPKSIPDLVANEFQHTTPTEFSSLMLVILALV